MLAHNLKDILTLVPELEEHIKQANFEEEFPLDNKDGALASYMRCEYLTKVARKIISPEKVALVKKAVSLYGATKEAELFSSKLVEKLFLQKQAALDKANTNDAVTSIAMFEGQATGRVELQKLAEQAESLIEQFPEEAAKSDTVRVYACKGYFHKEAAVASLHARAKASGNQIYEKVAEIIQRGIDDSVTDKEIRHVSKVVTELDKTAGLSLKGFNFYKETQLIKEAKVRSVLLVKLAGKNVPYESIHRFGMERIASVLGKDVTSEMNGNPLYDKQILESLPLDSQRVLANVIGSY